MVKKAAQAIPNQLLRRARLERGWTQQVVAERIGAPNHMMVTRWERGKTFPSPYYVERLCQLFDVKASALGLLRDPAAPRESPAQEPPAGQDQVAASEELALWTVPYARNPHFTGRDELLDHVMQQLAPPASGQPSALRRAALTQAQIITGLGGIGKTQTAIEYAYRAREQGRYTHTLWLAAGSEEALLMSFASLAERLPGVAASGETETRKLVDAVLRWLEQCQEPWLLLVDNADDLSQVAPYLPLQGNGSVLLTTRASAASWLASPIEVDTMGVREGAELLLRRAQREASATDEEINEAANLVVALGQFPLALDQAGAYIEETGCSLSDYLQLYQTHRHALLSRRGRQARGYPDSVATTWSLSFQSVEESQPAAADLLRLCAFLAPDHIPEELLIEGAPHWPAALQQAVGDRFRFNQVLERLLAFSLVKRLAEERLLSVHRLVQVVQQERLSREEQRQWAQRLVRAMHAVFPREPQEGASWPQCQRYLEQVQACGTLIEQQHLRLSEAADVLDRAGTYLQERALYSLAEPLYRQALSIWEQQRIPDPRSRARSLHHLANLAYWQDQPAQAEAFYQQALALREQQVGPEHLDVAESLHQLAGLYRMQGKYEEAEPLYLRALAIREQQLGEAHLDVAESFNGLATLYEKQGQYARAEALARQALAIREKQLGETHPQVAESLNDLALLYREQGKYVEAEPLFQRALSIWEHSLGPEHPQVAYPLNNLAYLYREQGKYAKAEPLYQRAVRIRERQLGPGHRNLAYPLGGLAVLYSEQGKYAKAEPLFQRALAIREQQLGPEHPDTATTLHDLATLREQQGHSQEALALYQRALAIREQALGPEHPRTRATREQLMALRARIGQEAGAPPEDTLPEQREQSI